MDNLITRVKMKIRSIIKFIQTLTQLFFDFKTRQIPSRSRISTSEVFISRRKTPKVKGEFVRVYVSVCVCVCLCVCGCVRERVRESERERERIHQGKYHYPAFLQQNKISVSEATEKKLQRFFFLLRLARISTQN